MATTSSKATAADNAGNGIVHFLVLGPGGAGVVCEAGEVGFLEVRVSVAGVVIPWGESAFVRNVFVGA